MNEPQYRVKDQAAWDNLLKNYNQMQTPEPMASTVPQQESQPQYRVKDQAAWDNLLKNYNQPASQPQHTIEATYGDRIKEFTRGALGGFGKVTDTAIAAGNALHGGASEVIGGVTGALGANKISEAFNQQAEQDYAAAKDYWKNPHTENIKHQVLQTPNTPDKLSGVLEAAGDLAGQAPAWVAASPVAASITAGAKIAPILQKPLGVINNFLSTGNKGVTAVAAEFAGAGAGAKALETKDMSTGEGLIRNLVGGVLGGMSVNAVSAKIVPVYKSAIDFNAKVIEAIKSPDTKAQLTELAVGVEHSIYEGINKSIDFAKNTKIPDFDPMRVMYEKILTSKSWNPNLKIDQEAIDALKNINASPHLTGSIEENVFNVTKENKAAYVLARWFPHENLRRMYKANKQGTEAIIQSSVDKHLGDFESKIGAFLENNKTGENNRIEEVSSTMDAVSNKVSDELQQFVNSQKELKTRLYEKLTDLIEPTDTINTSYLAKQAETYMNKVFGEQPSPEKKAAASYAYEILKKYTPQKINGKNTTNTISAKQVLEDQRNLAAYANEDYGKPLKNYKSLISGLDPLFEDAINLAASSGTLTNAKEILKTRKEADLFYSDLYAPLVQTKIIQTITKGEKLDPVFTLMNTREGIAEVGKVLKYLDDFNKDLRIKKMGVSATDSFSTILARQRHFDKTAPATSLKDVVFRTKAQQLLSENLYTQGEFTPDNFTKLFDNKASEDILEATMGKKLFKELKTEILPMSKKLRQIAQMDREYGGGITGTSYDARTMDNISTKTLTAAALSAFGIGGGSMPASMGIGATLLGTKVLLASSFSKAATNPKTVKALINACKKEDDGKTLIKFLGNVMKMDVARYKALGVPAEFMINAIVDRQENYNDMTPKERERADYMKKHRGF